MSTPDSPPRRRLKIVLLVVGLVGLTALAWWYETRPPKVIIFISIDTLRRDHVSAYAADGATPAVRTPALDAIARAGVRFDAAEAPSPLTRPSHQTMFTGLWPPEHGVRDNHSLPLPPRDARSFETLAETLSDDGWQCAAFVSAQPLSAKYGLDAGFSTYDEPDLSGRGGKLAFGERPANETVDRVVSWLDDERDTDRPLFLWVHLFDPHRPYAPPAHFVSEDDRSPAARYAGEVAFVDAEIRRLRDALAARGIDEESAIFVVVGDHGEGLGEHGESTHGWLVRQSTLAVPLLIAGPDIEADQSVSNVVRLVDLRSTLLAAAGVRDAPPDAGTDLASLMEGKPDAHGGPRPAYAESLHGYRECGWAQVSSLRADRWKLIDVGPRRELYDLLADPRELADLAATRPDDVARLLAALETFRTRASLAQPKRDPSVRHEPFGYGVLVEPERVSNFLDPTTNGKLRAVVDSMALVERLEHGRQLVQARSYDRAITLFDEVIEVDPRNPSVPFWRAYATFEQFRKSSSGTASVDDAARFAILAWDLGARTVAVRDLAVMTLSLGREPAAALGFAERSYETVPPSLSSRHAEANAHNALRAWEPMLDRLEDAVSLIAEQSPDRGSGGIRSMLEWLSGSAGVAAGVPAESVARASALLDRLTALSPGPSPRVTKR